MSLVLAAGLVAAGVTACSDDSAINTRDTTPVVVPTPTAETTTGTDTGSGTETTGTDTGTETTSGIDKAEQQRIVDQYVALEESTIDGYLESDSTFSAIAVDGTVEEHGNLVIFSYVYAEAVPDAASLAAAFDSQIDSFSQQGTTSLFPAMRQLGMEGAIYSVYEYQNADTTPIWSHTFMEDATGATCNFPFTGAASLPATCADA